MQVILFADLEATNVILPLGYAVPLRITFWHCSRAFVTPIGGYSGESLYPRPGGGIRSKEPRMGKKAGDIANLHAKI